MKNVLIIVFLMIITSCKSHDSNKDKDIVVYQTQIDKEEFESDNKITSRFTLKSKNKKFVKLYFNDGKEIFFKNNTGKPYDENRIEYNQIKSENPNKFLVSVKEYERSYFLLLDKDNKMIDTIPSYPYFSKDKNIFFVADYNPYETYENITPPSEDVYLYMYVKNQFKKIYFKPYHFFSDTYLGRFFWKNDTHLYLEFINEANKEDIKYISLKIASE